MKKIIISSLALFFVFGSIISTANQYGRLFAFANKGGNKYAGSINGGNKYAGIIGENGGNEYSGQVGVDGGNEYSGHLPSIDETGGFGVLPVEQVDFLKGLRAELEKQLAQDLFNLGKVDAVIMGGRQQKANIPVGGSSNSSGLKGLHEGIIGSNGGGRSYVGLIDDKKSLQALKKEVESTIKYLRNEQDWYQKNLDEALNGLEMVKQKFAEQDELLNKVSAQLVKLEEAGGRSYTK